MSKGRKALVGDDFCTQYHCAGDCGRRGHGIQHMDADMSENTTPAKCSEAVYQAARAAGVLIVTTGEEAAIQKFAAKIYALGYSDGVDFVATGEAPNERELFPPAARPETMPHATGTHNPIDFPAS